MERGYFRSYYLEIASLGALLGGFLKVYISIFACWFIEVNAHICLVTCVVRKKCLVTPSAEGGGRKVSQCLHQPLCTPKAFGLFR